MRKLHIGLALIALFFSQQALAITTDSESKPCEKIVNACISGGFVRDGGTGKNFWIDCMKPVLLNRQVEGVTLDNSDIKLCRKAKIQKLQQELQQLRTVKN